jgi:hypothetical protein
MSRTIPDPLIARFVSYFAAVCTALHWGSYLARCGSYKRKGLSVFAVILLALIAIALFGVGFAIHVLWWVAVAAVVIWLIGFAAHGGGRRWYYW